MFEDLGYRRFEWKCDALNAPSRAAALRYGFTFEGIFSQAVVTRRRNRNTAWCSIIDSEFPALHTAYSQWLNEHNLDEKGKQITSLGEISSCKKIRAYRPPIPTISGLSQSRTSTGSPAAMSRIRFCPHKAQVHRSNSIWPGVLSDTQ